MCILDTNMTKQLSYMYTYNRGKDLKKALQPWLSGRAFVGLISDRVILATIMGVQENPF